MSLMLYALLAFGLLTLLALAFTFLAATTIKNEALRPTRTRPAPTVEIIAVQADAVTLRPADGNRDGLWKQEGRWGLRWSQGHGQLGRILASDTGRVLRRFESFLGSPAPGTRAVVNWAAHPDDVGTGFGLSFQPARYTSRLGRFEAAFLPGESDTWMLFVHGKRGAAPRKPPRAYPILPIAAAYGFPCLDVSYRNDSGVPPSPDGLHRYGFTEWEDLEGASRHAIDHGASRLILVGYSMGGAIVTSFLYRSELAGRVRGVILDAPVLDLNAVIDFGIHRRGIPDSLTRPGRWLAGRLYGIDWSALDYLREADRLSTPILLVHGEEDPVVPVAGSDRLAALRPDIVTYLRIPDASHGHSWNVAGDEYERAVREFLDRLPD